MYYIIHKVNIFKIFIYGYYGNKFLYIIYNIIYNKEIYSQRNTVIIEAQDGCIKRGCTPKQGVVVVS